MRTQTRATAIVAAISLVLGLTAAGPLGASAAVPRTISGTVYLGDTAQAAGAGAVVVRYGVYGEVGQAGDYVTTNSAGHYEITGLDSSSLYSLYFDYVGAGAFSSIYSNGQPLGSLDFGYVPFNAGAEVFDRVLPANKDFTGTVSIDTAGHPTVGNVTVYYERLSTNPLAGSFGASSWLPAASAAVGSDGTYVLPALRAGTYRLFFDYTGSSSVSDRWWLNGTSAATAQNYAFGVWSGTQLQGLGSGGPSSTISEMVLPASSGLSISGAVRLGSGSNDAPAGDVRVYYRSSTESTLDVSRSVLTGAAGSYSIGGLNAGSYELFFDYIGSSGYLDSWYNSVPALTTPTVSISISSSVTGRNQLLTLPGSITGTVTLAGAGGAPSAGEVLVSYSALTSASSSTWSTESAGVPVAAGGAYTLPDLPAGSYRVHFTYAGAGSYQSIWHSSSFYRGNATTIVVSGATATTLNFVQPETRTLSGTVYLGSTSTPAGAGTVSIGLEYWDLTSWQPLTGVSATTAADGTYSISGLASRGYRATYTYLGGDGLYEATKVVGTSSGGTQPSTSWNTTLARLLTVSGTVHIGSASTPAASGEVSVEFRNASGTLIGSAFTAADGTYAFSLPAGSYSITYNYVGSSNASDLRSPTTGVSAISADSVRNVTLPRSNWVSGLVVDSAGDPIVGAQVYVSGRRTVPVNSNYAWYVLVYTDADGRYEVRDVPDGSYTIRYSSADKESQAWPYSYKALGEEIDVSGGQIFSGYDAELWQEGTILVNVSPLSLAPADYSGTTVMATLYVLDPVNVEWQETESWAIASASTVIDMGNLSAGLYFVRVSYSGSRGYDSSNSPVYAVEPGSTDTFTAELKPANLTSCVDNGGPLACRIGGATRFNVSATISELGFDPGVGVVYIANGLNYPDALSAAPAAALEGGPLLLVEPDSIPGPIASEIARLHPERIVVVGGPASVSPAVFNQLAGMAPVIDRITGQDRYDVSRAMAEYAFGEFGASVAYITTGNNFPDALSAGGAASQQFAPVITVDGFAQSVDAETRQLLIDLGVSTVKIAGGPGSVSPALMASIDAIPGISVIRLSGATRYEASGAINRDAFTSADVVFLAVGTNYPDALSGGALAGAFGSPLYVIPSDCIPSFVMADINAFEASTVIVLGGPGSVSNSVLDYTVCS